MTISFLQKNTPWKLLYHGASFFSQLSQIVIYQNKMTYTS